MKKLILVLLLALAPVACHPPATIVTQPGKIAFAADQVLVRVGELQNTALQANQTGGLDDANTRIIMTFASSAATVLKAAPAGWQVTLIKLWQETQPKITTANPTVQLAITAVTGVIGAL